MTVRDMFLGANKEEYVPGGTVTVGAYGNQGSQSTIAYNGSFYLVQGHNGYESGIWKSTSGVDDWTYVASLYVAGGDLYYLNNQFILFSDSGTAAYTSTDGVTWTSLSPNLYTYVGTNSIAGLIWDGTQYLAFANSLSGSPGLWSSPDLITWTQLSTDNVHSLASNGTVWVRTSGSNDCYYSTNLSTWTAIATGGYGFAHVTYTNGYFVICVNNGWYYSNNGTTWALVSAGWDLDICLYSGNTWVFARNGTVSFVPDITSNASFTTVDIETLKNVSSNYSLSNYHVNNMCTGPSGTCLLSIGDMDFMRITSPTTYDFHLKNEPPHRTYIEYSGVQLTFYNFNGAKAGWGKNTNSGALGQKIILSNDYIPGSNIQVGEGGVIYLGSTLKASGTTNHLKKVVVGPSGTTIVAVGDGGVVVRSTDTGANWSLAATLGGNLRSVCWVQSLSLFIAVGTGGAIWTSPTGATWTSRTSGTANNLSAITSFTDVEDGLVKIVIVGDSNTFIRSTNGTTWSYFTMSLVFSGESFTGNFNGIAYGLGVLVITGYETVNNVRYSSCWRSPFTTLVPGEQNVWTYTWPGGYTFYGIRFDAAAQAFVLPTPFNSYSTLSY
jgi:hypothetical protein